MKSFLFLMVFIFGLGCLANLADVIEPMKYQWPDYPKLSADQRELLLLYKRISSAAVETRARLEAERDRLAAKLGPKKVRPAKAGEIWLAGGEKSGGVPTLYNPTEENLAMTVAIAGDEKWQDSRMASIGHEVYLPAKARLAVPAILWTTPRTEKKELSDK